MVQHTNFFWTFAFAALTVYVVVSLVHSTYGSGFLAVATMRSRPRRWGSTPPNTRCWPLSSAPFLPGSRAALRTFQTVHPSGGIQLPALVRHRRDGDSRRNGEHRRGLFCRRAADDSAGVACAVASYPWLPDWLRPITENRMILYSLLLIILMLTRPQGLFGAVNLKRRRHERALAATWTR